MFLIVCPSCREPLVEQMGNWSCAGCSRSYRSLRGIPDLRTTEDAYLSNVDDWEFARKLDAAFDGLDFRGLLDLYFELSPEVRPDQRARQIAHILTAGSRSRDWIAAIGGDQPEGPWLDLGCGSGSFLAENVGPDRDLIGVDVAMRWLLVARKRLDEAGLPQIRLVCGNAECLPFGDQAFAAIIAGDVIEHVADQSATLSEAHRVLKPGGRLFMATPNRFSLAPEPHVGVWGVGFLPRRWMGVYVRAVRQIDFRAIRTLSYVGWTRILRLSLFGEASIVSPSLPEADLATMGGIKLRLAIAYNRLVANRFGQRLMRAVGPLFHIVATRRDGLRPSP
jgi:SAM-dependent methyltransferase